MSNIRVAICIPSGDHVHADFAIHLAGLSNQCKAHGDEPDIPIAIINVKSSLVACGRNELVQKALELGVTHCLFLDSDMVFPVTTLRRLLSHGVDIVGGTYIARKPPHVMHGKAEGGALLEDWAQTNAINPRELQRVDALPFGCMLVKTSVLANVAEASDDLPFQTPLYYNTLAGKQLIEGEDYFFCRRARELGHLVHLDWIISVNLRHLGQEAFQIPVSPAVEQEKKIEIVH